MVSSRSLDPAVEIRMVRENLALALSFWTTVKKGLITPEHLPAGRAVVTSNDGKVVEVFNSLELKGDEDLLRCATNQVRGAFAFSAMQAHRTLESVYAKAPLQEDNPDHKAARCSIYLLNNTLRHGLLMPVWACPMGYRQRFEVRPISFVLDASDLDSQPVLWDHFGGLDKYLDLLEYCAGQIEQQPLQAERPGARSTGDATAAQIGVLEALSRAEPLARFIADRCLVGPDLRTIAGGLYSEYLDWCQATGRAALGQRSFGMQLAKLGFTRRRRGRGRHWWEGIELAEAPP